MPSSMIDLIAELESIAAYDGPWLPLRGEARLLYTRVAELREREARLDDVLIVALVGGSGVGKSTLLNAIAGDQLAKTSPYRPCTAVPTIYHPPGARLPFEDWPAVSGSALENLVLIDTPDSDTIEHEHRQRVVEALGKCDLILLCGSMEKYLDEATWSLLRPLQKERTFVCVETKAEGDNSIRDHWQGRLKEQGFVIAEYFRVNALRSLDRKLAGGVPRGPELDFERLEAYLRDELTAERIARIKRSNATGLLTKTIARLHERVSQAAPALAALDQRIAEDARELARESVRVIEGRLFAESHLWNFALGRELGLRSKGIVGTCYRVIEALRSLPARMAGWLPWGARSSTGRDAAALLSSKALFREDLEVATEEVVSYYRTRQSDVALAFARAGFAPPDVGAGIDAFREALNSRVTGVLRGPARDGVIRRARWLTNWFVTLLLDLPPLGLAAYSAYIIVSSYLRATVLDSAFLLHSAAVLAIVLGLELFALSVIMRVLAWSARRAAAAALRHAFFLSPLAFAPERALLADAAQAREKIERLRETVLS